MKCSIYFSEESVVLLEVNQHSILSYYLLGARHTLFAQLDEFHRKFQFLPLRSVRRLHRYQESSQDSLNIFRVPRHPS